MSDQQTSSENEQERARIRRHILYHTPPRKDNPHISFTEHFRNGRIVIPGGYRIVDWDGKEWSAFAKDGVQWVQDDLTDADLEVLASYLSEELKLVSNK